MCTIERVAERPWIKSLTPSLNACNVVQDIFLCDGEVEGMFWCAMKNELSAWGRSEAYLFRSTFRNGKVEKTVRCELPAKFSPSTVWSKNGKYVATKISSNLQVWDMSSGTKAQQVGQTISKEWQAFLSEEWPYVLCDICDDTGDGKRLALSARIDLQLWDVETGQRIGENWQHAYSTFVTSHAQRVEALSFSPDGKRLLSVGSAGSYVLLSAETGKKVREHHVRVASEREVRLDRGGVVSWSRKGKRVASHASNGVDKPGQLCLCCWIMRQSRQVRRADGESGLGRY